MKSASQPITPPYLPHPGGAFVGRETLVDEVAGLLQAPGALVSLLGVGGVGKTRVALAVAARFESDLRVRFVDLSSCSGRSEAHTTVLHALGLQTPEATPSVDGAVIAHLRALGTTLLVLDNFESSLEVARDARTWLDRCPKLRVLVTSRCALDVAGEHRVSVEPLSLQSVHGVPSPAASLYLARARERGCAVLDARELRAVEALVEMLDGLPLAIELAAARGTALAPTAMLPLLSQRFELLIQTRRDAPSRHRSLAATLDASWERLTDDERTVLAACATLGTRVRVEALAPLLPVHLAEHLVAVLAVLQSLADQSLVRFTREPDGTRITLLETVRLFTLERLDLARRTPVDRWVAAIVAPVRTLEDLSIARHLRLLLARASDLRFDQLAALANVAFALTKRSPHVLPSAEACALWSTLLTHLATHDDGELTARLLLARGRAQRWRGAFEHADEDLAEALRASQIHVALRGELEAERARLEFNRWRFAESRDAAVRAVALAREANDCEGLARALELRAWVHFLAAEHEEALRCYDEAAQCWAPSAPPALAANRALCLLDCGHVEAAERLIERALSAARNARDALAEATAIGFLGAVHRRRGAGEAALRCFDDAAARCGLIGHVVWQCVMVMEAGLTLLDRGRWSDAIERLEAACEQIDALPGHACAAIVRVCLALAQAGAGNLTASRVALAEASTRVPDAGPIGMILGVVEAAITSANAELPPLDAPLWQRLGDHVVILRRVLERVRERCFPPDDALIVGASLRLPGGAILTGPRGVALQRILRALARAAHDTSLDVDALFSVGWPEEQCPRNARINRVRVAVSTLRRLGLGNALRFEAGGYRLVGLRVIDYSGS